MILRFPFLGQKLSDKEVDELIKDAAVDGRINYEILVDLLVSEGDDDLTQSFPLDFFDEKL